MTVQELIEELGKYSPSAPVYGGWEGILVEVKSVQPPDPAARARYFGKAEPEEAGSAWSGLKGPGPILDVDA